MKGDNEIMAMAVESGPLHEVRFQVVNRLRQVPVQTGDIFYRSSNAKGPLGLPFSKILSRLTRSNYTHAALALVENGEIGLLEITDQGTLLLRAVDWVDWVYSPDFRVYRLKQYTEDTVAALGREIHRLLDMDADYDFTFSRPDRFYCTEAVASVYRNVGMSLVEPQYPKEVVSPWVYPLLRAGNFLFRKATGDGLPLDQKLYYVGNESHGLMSSPLTECVFSY